MRYDDLPKDEIYYKDENSDFTAERVNQIRVYNKFSRLVAKYNRGADSIEIGHEDSFGSWNPVNEIMLPSTHFALTPKEVAALVVAYFSPDP